VGDKIKIIDSVGYIDFIKLLLNSKFVMTDSGGVQEESAILNVPCLILREETEWMRYVKLGKNILVGIDENNIIKNALELINDESKLRKMKDIETGLIEGVGQKIIKIIKEIESKNEL
ncbi:UDP-N-acetylglucosamine 2-epimerase, partial [Candidatus Woesearchaeota archaeon]|nr:UDP-N-acetylglucosamine 2-epimerase [Candidatus Woesearchaeota archaeon]